MKTPTPSRAILIAAGVLVLAILIKFGVEDGRPRTNASTTVTLPIPVSGQSIYSLQIVDKSDNMSCEAIHVSGGTLISIYPPHNIDRQMAILPPNGKWLFLNRLDYQVREGVLQRILINPETDSVFEYGRAVSAGHDDYIRLPFYQGWGVYEFLFSDNLEQDRELIEDQAWCRILIRKN